MHGVIAIIAWHEFHSSLVPCWISTAPLPRSHCLTPFLTCPLSSQGHTCNTIFLLSFTYEDDMNTPRSILHPAQWPSWKRLHLAAAIGRGATQCHLIEFTRKLWFEDAGVSWFYAWFGPPCRGPFKYREREEWLWTGQTSLKLHIWSSVQCR